tara:strand:- start:2200 stop:2346 length:147 start_codon:yes stop_codon:yes gene_type:complete
MRTLANSQKSNSNTISPAIPTKNSKDKLSCDGATVTASPTSDGTSANI